MPEGLLHIAIGAFFMVVVNGFAHHRVRRETARNGDLSRATRGLMLLAFGGFGGTIAVAAFTRAWPLSMGAESPYGVLRGVAGIALIAMGALIVAAVFAGSRKRTWAVDTDRLSTTGIYGRTRNPRAVGWFLVYLGVALTTRSGAALALAPIFLLGYLPWILLEETALERHFGDEYRAYRRRTPRFV